jgi:hypothetical protein
VRAPESFTRRPFSAGGSFVNGGLHLFGPDFTQRLPPTAIVQLPHGAYRTSASVNPCCRAVPGT